MVLSLTPVRAHAESVERLADEALIAYKQADYARAIELLQRAYKIRQVPTLLYNLARAYDQIGDADRAYEAYRRYSHLADADPTLKTRAVAHLVLLEETRRKRTAPSPEVSPSQATPKPSAPSAAAPPPPAVDTSRPPPAVETSRPPPEPPRQRGWSSQQKAALALGVLGLASVGAGIAFGVTAQSLERRSDDICPTVRCNDPQAIDLNRTARAYGLVLTVTTIGGGALVAAAIGWTIGLRVAADKKKRARVSMVPALAPTGIGLWGAY